MNIDMHFHVIPRFFLDELGRDNPWGKRVVDDPDKGLVLHTGPLTFAMQPNHYDTDAILESMDGMRLDVAAISPSPMLFHSHLPADQVLPLHRRINDHLAQMAAHHPSRFRPLGIVPLQSPDLAVGELARVFDLGLAGVEIETNIAGKNLDAKEFWPVYEQVQERGGVIFLHPAAVLGVDRLRAFYLSNLIGNPTDTAVAAAHLIFGGVLEAFPDLQIVLPHGGGTTAFLCGRWEHGARVRNELAHVQTLPLEQVRRFYFDSLTHSDAALSLVIELAGAEKIVLGSDHPYDMGEPDPVGKIENRSDLSRDEKRAILGGTARRMLGI